MSQLLLSNVGNSIKIIEIDQDGSNEITAICTSPNYFVVAREKVMVPNYQYIYYIPISNFSNNFEQSERVKL